jgi:hypothetical protein
MKMKLQKFDHEPSEWGSYKEKIGKFKDDFIYKSIFREMTSENMYIIPIYWINHRFHATSSLISWIRSDMSRERGWRCLCKTDKQTHWLRGLRRMMMKLMSKEIVRM